VISLQLGAGCSITAINQGVAVETSMGFSPLEGLMMATRAGDVDPGLLIHLQRALGMTVDEVEQLLNHDSGLLGVSGISDDMQRLLESEQPDARLAVAMYCHRARKYVGAYMVVLGGVDAILFGGGVGENSPEVRNKILQGLEFAGVRLNESANANSIGQEACISVPRAVPQVWAIPVDEAAVIARAVLSVTDAHRRH
jgi:acetate kinase